MYVIYIHIIIECELRKDSKHPTFQRRRHQHASTPHNPKGRQTKKITHTTTKLGQHGTTPLKQKKLTFHSSQPQKSKKQKKHKTTAAEESDMGIGLNK